MTFTLLIVIGAAVGFLFPSLLGDSGYGVPADIGLGGAGGLIVGLILKAVVGGAVASAIGAVLGACLFLVAVRQVRKVRDKQERALANARLASRRARSR